MATACTVEDCDRPVNAHGLCTKHYQQPDTCRIGGCERPVYCKQECRSHYSARYSREYREKHGRPLQRANRLSWMYGLSLDDYDLMLDEQGGGCAICGSTDPGGQGCFHVDHDHDCCTGYKTCGKCVRALLCSRCNQMLGLGRHSIEVLKAAAAYLASFEA